jgi:AcrR family transcriptional regulator
MEPMTQVRPYRGVQASDRVARRRAGLLAAGLELLGGAPGAADPAELTVRAVCRQAGVATRYFYESFTDKDQFVGDVFDWVISGIATSTQAAVAAAPLRERNRAAMATIVRTVDDDPRIGRLVFSTDVTNSLLVRKRVESGGLLAMLYGRDVGAALQVAADTKSAERVKAAAHFAVGGVGQTISAWLAGAVALSADDLVGQLTSMLDELADPRLYPD